MSLKHLIRGEGWLRPGEVAGMLSCYGLPQVEQRIVASIEEAGKAAEELGGEVTLKAIATGWLHKTESGAVKLHLRGALDAVAAAYEMSSKLKSLGYSPSGFIVHRMVHPGVEMLIGMVHDRSLDQL